MWVGVVVTTSWASPPNETVRLFEVDDGGGYVERMQLADGLLVGRTRNSGVGFLLNTSTWETEVAGKQAVGSFVGPDDGGCTVSAIATSRATTGHDVWVACEDGRLLRYAYDGSGKPVAVEDGEVQVDPTRLDGLWYDEVSNALYAWSSVQGQSGVLHYVDPSTLTVDPAGKNHPKTSPIDGFQEGVLLKNTASPTLVISHGGARMSQLIVGPGTNTFLVNNAVGGAFGCADLCEAPNNEIFCVDPGGVIARYNLINRSFFSLGLVLDQPRGVGASLDPTDGWVAVTGNQVNVWELSETSTIVNPDRPYYQSPTNADNPIQDILTADGYLFGGGEAGYIHIVTQNPWIYPGTIILAGKDGEEFVAQGTFLRGDRVGVGFAVNKPGSWEIAIGGDTWDSGRVIASGDLTAIEPQQTETGEELEAWAGVAEFDVDERFAEGANHLWLRARSDLGDIGHASASIVVDNLPARPGLDLGFGSGRISAQILGIPDADLDHYELWISDVPFDAADFATGGPVSFREGRSVKAAPGEDPSIVFGGLENGHSYYVAARAYDAAGGEGPMSAVVSEVPREVYPLSKLVGDEGGTPCSTGPAAPSGLLALFGAALLRRRRWVAAALLAPGLASAADRKDADPWWRQDTTPQTGNFEVRYGTFSPTDPALDEGYSLNAKNMLNVEVGPQFFHVLEIDVGTGFFQELDFMRASDGAVSDQRQMMTWFPFMVDGTLRAHFVDEQPAVPFVRYGWDYVIWSEKFDVAPGGPKDAVRGAKFGTHYSLGANLLLDLVQPARASFLETRTGINDSWLTVEWRRQHVDSRERPWSGRQSQVGKSGTRDLDFSGDAFTLGLKLDW